MGPNVSSQICREPCIEEYGDEEMKSEMKGIRKLSSQTCREPSLEEKGDTEMKSEIERSKMHQVYLQIWGLKIKVAHNGLTHFGFGFF